MERPASYTLILFVIAISCFLFFFAKPGFGDFEKGRVVQLLAEDSSSMQILASYPDDVKLSVLRIAKNTRALNALNDLQLQTSGRFRDLLAGYPQPEQEKIWNLVSRDGFLDTAISCGLRANKDCGNSMQMVPAKNRSTGQFYTLTRYDLLLNINHIKKDFQRDLGDILNPLPDSVRVSFRQLILHPELLNLMHGDILFTERLGALDPKEYGYLYQQLALLNAEGIRKKSICLSDWKKRVDNNPVVLSELLSEINDYKTNQRDTSDWVPLDSGEGKRGIYVPYAYWCGYPWWRDYCPWYNYPYWFRCGFYAGNDGIRCTGLPVAQFLKWHFHEAVHFYRYPFFTDLCIEYYDTLPGTLETDGHLLVSQWINDHQKYFSDDFVVNRKERPVRLKEYGKFILDFNELVNRGIEEDGHEDEFLSEHIADYPHLRSVLPGKLPERHLRLRPGYMHKQRRSLSSKP